MITITGAKRRAFIFPAPVDVAFDFYRDLPQTFAYLPHITLARTLADDTFRMRYSSLELSSYNIHIFADIEAHFDEAAYILRIQPVPGSQPVKPKARMNTATANGCFYIQSWFTAAGDKTHVEFYLKLEAELPRPLGMRFMPRSVVDRIAQGIAERRMREIIEGFIENSVAAYDNGSAQIVNP